MMMLASSATGACIPCQRLLSSSSLVEERSPTESVAAASAAAFASSPAAAASSLAPRAAVSPAADADIVVADDAAGGAGGYGAAEFVVAAAGGGDIAVASCCRESRRLVWCSVKPARVAKAGLFPSQRTAGGSNDGGRRPTPARQRLGRDRRCSRLMPTAAGSVRRRKKTQRLTTDRGA